MKKALLVLLLATSFITACKKSNNSKPSTPVTNTVVSTLAGGFAGVNSLTIDATGDIYETGNGINVIGKITPAGVESTFAGDGINRGMGGVASFNDPSGVAVDAAGNVYVSDMGMNLIRKITSAGVVSNFSGSGYSAGIAVDAVGNIYVTDSEFELIRKISSIGVFVSNLAGSGKAGNAYVTGSQASFSQPVGIAVDAAGNVYVADTGNNLIRKITQTGVVSTFAGSGSQGSTNGIGTVASFYNPTGVAVDTKGNVYVADAGNQLIRKITPTGVVSTFAGSGLRGSFDGMGAVASFNEPSGVAVDAAGNVYVADTGNSLIRKIVVQ